MAKVKSTCLQCGETFFYRKSQYKDGTVAKYCSRECFFNARRTDKTINRVCKYCGKEFDVKKSKIDAGNGVYCCSVCQRKGSGITRIGQNRTERISKTCETCGKPFSVRKTSPKANRFCSLHCYHIAKKGQRPSNYRRTEHVCLCCGKIFIRLSGKYCSTECKTKHMKGKYAGSYRGGLSFEPYCEKFNNDLKDRVRAYFNNKCFVCGKVDIKRKLSVHHVNYDKMVCCNDVKPLFVPLCHSCHSKTNNNRDQWEEYFTKRLHDEYNDVCYLPA